jgi:N-acetylmuramoyl-L-alanine amidase
MFLLLEALMPSKSCSPARAGTSSNRPDTSIPAAVARDISDILSAVRNSVFVVGLIFAVAVFASEPRSTAAQVSPAPVPEPAQPPPAPAGPVIVLDPAHGGTDTGARGETAVEKDVVLQIARSVRAELERRGYRVVLTRNDDSNPSYDDRAALANAYHDAIFISLHVASTGADGTVRTYYTQFSTPVVSEDVAATPSAKAPNPAPPRLLQWEEAQRPYLNASHLLADLIQGELAQAFSGSPQAAMAVPVRALRSVTSPAVAIEISSVSAPTPGVFTASGGPLANAIALATAASRPASSQGPR